MKDVKVSVVIPVYNTEKYLEDCLESIVNQTVSFDKIVIVDDGSPDNSSEIYKRYAEKYDNVSFIVQQNQRQGAARNNGLKLIEEGYVLFVDSDDLLSVDAVEYIKNVISKEKMDILYYDTDVQFDIDMGSKKNQYDRVGKVQEETISGIEYFAKNYPLNYTASTCLAAYNVEYLKCNKINYPEGTLYEDNYFAIKVMLEASRVRYCPVKLYIRRYRANSVMTGDVTLYKCGSIIYINTLCWEYIGQVAEKNNKKFLECCYIYIMNGYKQMREYLRKWYENNKNECVEYKVLIQDVAEKFINAWNVIEGYTKVNEYHTQKRVCELYDTFDDTEHELKEFFDRGIIGECRSEYESKLKALLENLPLNDEKMRVCIYGIGDHTDRLLWWYSKLCGNIRCEVIYADSYAKSYSKCYEKTEVLNIRDIQGKVDIIIVSSNEYEDEMCKLINELHGEDIDIIRFYEKSKENLFAIKELCKA